MIWPFSKKEQAPPERKYSGLMMTMGPALWTGHDYRKLAVEGYQNNPVVHACVNKIAKAISGIELKEYDYTRQGDLRENTGGTLLKLLNRPNVMQSGRSLAEKLVIQYLIGGNAYLMADNEERVPNALYLLQPDRVTVRNPLNDVLPQAYVYQPGAIGERTFPVNRVTGMCALLHLKTANPLNEIYGLPPMSAASYAIDVFNAGQEWNKSLLQNEGRPSGALVMQAGKDGYVPQMTDDQFTRLSSVIESEFSGSSNAGRPLLLEGGLDWKAMSLNSRDMDHKETLLANARFIAGVYGVPPMLVNIPGESTFSNFEQANLSFYTDTVLPLLGLLLDDINRWLPKLCGDEKRFAWYDEETIPALEARRAEKSKRINDSEFMTVNEKREAMGHEAYVEPAKPGADSIFVAAKDIPIELAGKVDPNLHPALAEDATADPNKPADPKKPAKENAGKPPAKSVE